MIHTQIRADSRYPIDRKRVRSLVEKILDNEGISSDVVVSVAVVGNRKMKTLNREYHGEDKTTDVLSFPYQDPKSSQDVGTFHTPAQEGMILGDIVVSYPKAVEQAREKGVLVDEEMDFLVEHGLNHLLGKHHD